MAFASKSPTRRAKAAISGLDVLQLLRVVIRVAGAHSARIERSTGIPGAQLWALHEVAGNEGVQVGELAARLRVHQTTASNLLNRLELHGLVRKVRAASDQRMVQVHPTAAGQKLLKRAPAAPRGLLPHALEALSPRQLRQVHDGLTILVDAVGGFDAALAGKPMPFTE